ncbi:mucin-2-like, partial [Chiloscyllium plagiosum]|uniref:mucin-2-like n=1 Tax=Chiloscyllium plagiosum TaxID=36176 RepID=UPI001CB7BD08
MSTTHSTSEVTTIPKETTITTVIAETATTEETTTATVITTTVVPCNGVWSGWINNNTPNDEQKDDKEPLDPIRDTVCKSDTNRITNIQCETVTSPGPPISITNDTVTCDLNSGLSCTKPAGDDLPCLDYQIRVCCEPFETTTLPTTTTPVSSTTPPEECYCSSDPPRK